MKKMFLYVLILLAITTYSPPVSSTLEEGWGQSVARSPRASKKGLRQFQKQLALEQRDLHRQEREIWLTKTKAGMPQRNRSKQVMQARAQENKRRQWQLQRQQVQKKKDLRQEIQLRQAQRKKASAMLLKRDPLAEKMKAFRERKQAREQARKQAKELKEEKRATRKAKSPAQKIAASPPEGKKVQRKLGKQEIQAKKLRKQEEKTKLRKERKQAKLRDQELKKAERLAARKEKKRLAEQRKQAKLRQQKLKKAEKRREKELRRLERQVA